MSSNAKPTDQLTISQSSHIDPFSLSIPLSQFKKNLYFSLLQLLYTPHARWNARVSCLLVISAFSPPSCSWLSLNLSLVVSLLFAHSCNDRVGFFQILLRPCHGKPRENAVCSHMRLFYTRLQWLRTIGARNRRRFGIMGICEFVTKWNIETHLMTAIIY